jgi:diacylglycerol kinase (ATP)
LTLRTLTIVNQKSGRSFDRQGFERAMSKLINKFEHVHQNIVTPPSRDETITVVREAVLNGVTHVIVWGGDGSVNAVLQGVMQAAPSTERRPVIVILGGGSGSDFLRSIDRTSHDQITTVDVGVVDFMDTGERRWFLNGFSLGASAEIAARKELIPRKIPGQLKYFFATIQRLCQGHFYADVSMNGNIYTQAISLFITNGKFVGGGMKIKADAAIGDGFLDFVLIPRLNILGIAKSLWRAYTIGIAPNNDIIHGTTDSAMALEPAKNSFCELDGEVFRAQRLQISVASRSLDILVSY